MKKSIFYRGILLVMALSLSPLSCQKEQQNDLPGDPVPIVLTEKQKAVVDSANNFAFNIFKPIVVDSKGSGNILISPFSISSALTMALNGASGETYDGMAETLCLQGKTLEEINDAYLKLLSDMIPVDERVLVEIANSVWVEKKFEVKEPFINTLETYFKAFSKEFDVNDPGAKDDINNWIADKTHDKITNMIESIDPSTVMFLINAVYFNGKWRYKFDSDATTDKPFYLSGGGTKNVSTMYNETNLKVTRTGDATLVELPYGQGNYTMVVMLPDEGKTTADIASVLTSDSWSEWMTNMEEGTLKVQLSMPKFKYGYRRELIPDLVDLGMGVACSDLADFSNISDQHVVISEVLHQTFIETDEEGTEAAAATVVTFISTSIDPSLSVIDINRPFLYFIRETSTGTILFMGKVDDPSAE